MPSLSDIVAYIKFGRETLLKSIAGLSKRELTQLEIYPGWSLKEVLAHIAGWDQRVISNLELICQGRAGDITSVEADAYNQASVAARQDRSVQEILAEMAGNHHRIIELISQLDYPDIDRRHERNGRFITIRSYVIEIMIEHERRHTAEIELWRKELQQQIDPEAIFTGLAERRAEFMQRLSQISAPEARASQTVGQWSINDLVGHVADWEALILQAARHIHDPSLPAVDLLAGPEESWNELLHKRRGKKAWLQNYQELLTLQAAVDDFLAPLTPGDYALRGPFPWPTEHGTLAELITQITEHYEDHLLDLPA